MRGALVTALVVIATSVVGVGAAEGAIKKGSFSGTTAKGDPIGFKVDSRNRAYAFYVEGVSLSCTDGDRFDTPTGAARLQSPNSNRFRISSTRRWSATLNNEPSGNGQQVTSRFGSSGNAATGRYFVFAKFDTQNQPDPNGSVRCEGGPLKFTAARVS
jgi:hypothetical protein